MPKAARSGATAQPGARARRNTIGDAVRRAAAKHSTREALLYGDRRWTFADIDRAADRVARRFIELGLRKGDRVAAYGRNSDAYLLAWLGCVRAGLIHVPVNYALTGHELGYIIEQSGARALLFDPALEPNVAAVRGRGGVELFGCFEGGQGLDILAVARDEDAPVGPEVELAEDELAQILYTSGTTANPKGAMMTHRALMTQYMSCIIECELRGDDRCLAALPLYHSAQMHVLTMPHLLIGATTVLIQAPVPDLCLRLIEEQGINCFFCPPTVWISLLRHPDFDRRDLRSLQRIYYGASIMPLPVLQELRRRLPNARPFNCYGQSEIAPLATVLRPEDHDAHLASCGRPVLNVETRVVDPEMREVPPGTRGEIVHRSPQLLIGYWDKPAETGEAFAGGWFHSGDVGYFDEGGFLHVVDRVKDVIKTGGVLVASREVEEALFTHPGVSEVAVIGLPDPKWIEAVTAVVVLRPGATADEKGLIEHARTLLAPFKLPKRIIFAESLPKNTAGKLLKRELRARYGTTAAAFDSGAGAGEAQRPAAPVKRQAGRSAKRTTRPRARPGR